MWLDHMIYTYRNINCSNHRQNMLPNFKTSIALSANKITRGTTNSLIYVARMSLSEGESSIGGVGCQKWDLVTGGGLGGLADEVEARL